MIRPFLAAISPFFIVADLPRAIRFYREALDFEVRFVEPGDEPFFAIVGRDGVQILLKASAPPLPNYTRHCWAPWDGFVYVAEPDALAGELASRYVAFHKTIRDRDDGLRGFEVQDLDGYVLFFGRPR
jgi:catechol 2,3-dioxygenase-like lactoylglutathione lyase family enzyme